MAKEEANRNRSTVFKKLRVLQIKKKYQYYDKFNFLESIDTFLKVLYLKKNPSLES